MNLFIRRLVRLLVGLFLYALGIVFSINANIGYAPWDVFHVGIASTIGISIGTASIIVGLAIVAITLLLKEKIGLGTILNMILIGVCVDFIMWLHIIPTAVNLVIGIIMLIAGLFIIALGSYFYIGSAFGAGPRDSLMVAVARKTSFPVGVCRSLVEFCALIVGWMLGGMVGIGTIISVIAIGFCVQITFKTLKFDTTGIQHETFAQTYKNMFHNQADSFDEEFSEKLEDKD